MSRRWEERQDKEDRRFAMVAAVIANANRNPKKRRHPFRIDDFMPNRTGVKSRQTPQQQAAILRMAASVGGRR